MRPLFPSRTVALGRAQSESNLPDTCVATTPGAFIDDGEGGGTYADPVVDMFACRTWPLNAREMETLVADQLRQPGLEGLVFPVEVELDPLATLEITRHETGEVDRYAVKGIVPDPTYVVHRRAIIERIPDEEEGGS